MAKKKNNQYRYYQTNTQSHDYEHRMHHANVKHNHSNGNYHKFNNDNKVNKNLGDSLHRKIFPAHQS